MEPVAITTSSHDGKTNPPHSTIGLGETVESPATPLTPRMAVELAKELKQEVANEHGKSVNAKLFELIQVEEDEKKLLSAEVNRLRADRQKMKEYVALVENKLGKVHKFVGDRYKEFYPEE